MTGRKKQSTEAAVREIRRRTRRKFAPEEEIRRLLAPERAVIPDESATPAEPELQIACKGGEERL